MTFQLSDVYRAQPGARHHAGTSRVLSHLISWGAWKQADQETRRKSRFTEVTRLRKVRSKGPLVASAHVLPGAALSTLLVLTGPSHDPPHPF